MTTIHRHPQSDSDVVIENDVVTSSAARKALAVVRVLFGFTFLWAFLDKCFALGFSTGAITNDAGVKTGVDYFAKDAAWINGGSPTEGFLTHGVADSNPFQGFYNSIGGTVFADSLFMIGLLGLGLALVFGFGIRFAAAAGALLYVLMWTASLPMTNNPLFDEHILGAATLVVLGFTLAGDTWGVGKAWARLHLVREHGFLR
jgi:thiosulfate dehydrogenase [quinone] large subunit